MGQERLLEALDTLNDLAIQLTELATESAELRTSVDSTGARLDGYISETCASPVEPATDSRKVS